MQLAGAGGTARRSISLIGAMAAMNFCSLLKTVPIPIG
jgi:hypothetical protein